MTSLPPKVTAGEIVVCCGGHEVGRVRETLSLAHSITARAVSMDDGTVMQKQPGRITCESCGNPVARVLRDGRWSLRLSRGWVS